MYRFLYCLLLCADACFRLKNRMRSSDFKDPTLGPGWSYFGDNEPYIGFIKNYVDQEEVCSFSRRRRYTR